MPRIHRSLLDEYQKAHTEVSDWEIYLWTHFMHEEDAANRITYAYEDWLPTDHSTPPPDLVEWFALYGYINLRLKTWELPIKLSAQEKEQWREAGYYLTKEDFQNGFASVAGGIAEVAGKDPQLTAKIIRQQLDAKLAELEQLADLPLDQYTPEWQEWQIRKRYASKGHKGDALEELVGEDLDDEMHDHELQRFEKPFALRQQLESFEWGMECLRLIVMGENAPELGLPNKDLFRALLRIDANELLAKLGEIDVKLKRIWQNLAKYDCYCVNASYEPKRFWWRHWQQSHKK